MPSGDMREFELNEATWWGKWADETVWVSKNCYAIFSEAFKEETFFNRGGFLGEERVPRDAIEALEKEFAKRRRKTPCVLVEEGRSWDKMRSVLWSRGYAVKDRMIVMESKPRESRDGTPDFEAEISLLDHRSKGKDVQEWVRTYLKAFYGDQRLNKEVETIVWRLARDEKVSLVVARIGRKAAGCAAMFRTAGGVSGAYCIGTVPEFRRRGVASAMVGFMRETAEVEGRRLILQTLVSDSAECFYLKQGFATVYAKSLFERRPKARRADPLPSGESYGVSIDRSAEAGTTKKFSEVFSGFDRVKAVRALFGDKTEEALSKLTISLDSPRGYLRVDGETGNVIINPEYLMTGNEAHIYLDVIHELVHVRQFKEGEDLYDRRYAYLERPTEIEAYKVAVEEARRIGMSDQEIVDYLRVEWVTEEEFTRFVLMMRVGA